MEPVTAIGVMSGTSMDAIDVALLRTDGERAITFGPSAAYSYPSGLRAQLLAIIADSQQAEHGDLSAIEADVTNAHAGAVKAFIREHAITEKVSVVGLHGQTVFHAPQRRFTRQLLDGNAAARLLGIDVVYRFRHADVAAGGQGAPFVPLFHRALASHLPQPVMVLNLGGVANVTYLDGDTVIAFDTGPASALLDDFVLRRCGLAFDRDGALAASGKVNQSALQAVLANPFFSVRPPKSLDRNDFHQRASVVDTLSDADGAATLAAFTVEATVRALDHVPRAPLRWLVTGGGRLNATFMRLFSARLGVPVEPVESVGWDGDALEAQCFAYLAVRSLLGLPLSLPSTTGVPTPMPGGELVRAPSEQ